MEAQEENAVLIVKDNEILVRLVDGCVEIAELHCEEYAIVGYSLLYLRNAA